MFDFSSLPPHEIYLSSRPFPHAVILGAFDEHHLRKVEKEISEISEWSGQSGHQFARKKRWCNAPERLGKHTRELIEFLNSPAFLTHLERLTGIDSLVVDPYLEGGGIHSISAGGYLGIHADFNFHPKLHLHRRINLILYLNSDWQREWGGALELWSFDPQCREQEIFPELNTLVIFNTTDTSLHGHPKPLACPEYRRRNSIALYYYSRTRPITEMSKPHSTQYYDT